MVTLKINPKETHAISPHLYMQFMEPLGVCDSSVDAAWDCIENQWYQKVIDAVNKLSPTMIRFGGCFASYYHWKEAVGPRDQRIPVKNYFWGGVYTNQVGTHEIVDFCRRVNADLLMVVNMESDGVKDWAYPADGQNRFGTDDEAAEWVDYCNNPDNALRLSHGIKDPYNIKYWQVGNETSYYGPTGFLKEGFSPDECAKITERFVKKMRAVDPSIKIVGWGDRNHFIPEQKWAERMCQVEGIDSLAFHHHFGSGLPDSPLTGIEYRNDPEKTWMHLMNAHKSMQEHIDFMREATGGMHLAMTEGHFTMPGRNRNECLSTWGVGVAYARCHNVIMRNSDILDIATLADFFGNVWQNNAIIIPTPLVQPEHVPYLQPVASVMALFGRHQGKHALDISYSGAVDVVASRTGNKVYLHVANTDMNAPQQLKLDLGAQKVTGGIMEYIASDPMTEITMLNPDVFESSTMTFEGDTVTLPAAAVAAIEIDLA